MGIHRRISTLIIGIAAFAMLLLCQNSAYADNISDGSVPVGASLSGASVTVSTDGAVNIEVVPAASGSLGVGKNEVTVNTTAGTGYTLYISSANVDTSGYAPLYLNGNTSSSSKIASIPTSVASSLSANQWGYAVPSASGAGFAGTAQYNSALNISTADETLINSLKWKGISSGYGLAKTNNTAGTDTFPVYFGVRANTSIISGNYRNTIIYTAFVEGNGLVDINPGEIANSGDRATITTEYKAAGYPVSASDITVKLYDDDTSNIVAACSDIQIVQDGSSAPLIFSCAIAQGTAIRGVEYDIEVKVKRNDNNYYTYSGDNSWHFSIPTVLADNMYMQDVTSTTCANTPLYSSTSKTYALIDKRDNKQYLVRKLNDNKCWMVQNLALAGGRTIYGPGVSGHDQDSNLPSGVSYNIPDGTSYSGKFNLTTVENMYNGTHLDAADDNTTTNTGAYYNWNVATAGWDTAGSAPSGSNSDRSICPKGWRLPTSYSGFEELYQAYGSNKTALDSAFNITAYVGVYSGGELRSPGSTNWWSATSNPYALLVYDSGSIWTSCTLNDRSYGSSVRCVIK